MVIAHIVGAKIWGGGEQYVYDVSLELSKRGHQVYVFVGKEQEGFQKKYSEVATVICVDLHGLLGLGAYGALCRYLKKYKVDILNCHSGHYAFLSTLVKRAVPGMRLVMFRHNAQPNKKGLYHSWLRKQFDGVICVSRLVYDLQMRDLEKENIGKWHLVYSGINTEKFTRQVAEKTSQHFVVGYAGRLVEDKGLDVLIQAMGMLAVSGREVILKIAGAGRTEFVSFLKNKARELKIESSIEFVGQQEDMNSFYRGLDLFVLPSVVAEAFGLVICEAMYCSIPVISTSSGAQKEIIEDGKNGWIVPPQEVGFLKNKILEVMLNKEQTALIAQQGKITVSEKFTVDICVDNLENVYKKLLKNSWGAI